MIGGLLPGLSRQLWKKHPKLGVRAVVAAVGRVKATEAQQVWGGSGEDAWAASVKACLIHPLVYSLLYPSIQLTVAGEAILVRLVSL